MPPGASRRNTVERPPALQNRRKIASPTGDSYCATSQGGNGNGDRFHLPTLRLDRRAPLRVCRAVGALPEVQQGNCNSAPQRQGDAFWTVLRRGRAEIAATVYRADFPARFTLQPRRPPFNRHVNLGSARHRYDQRGSGPVRRRAHCMDRPISRRRLQLGLAGNFHPCIPAVDRLGHLPDGNLRNAPVVRNRHVCGHWIPSLPIFAAVVVAERNR